MSKSHEILNRRWNEMRVETWDVLESEELDVEPTTENSATEKFEVSGKTDQVLSNRE